MKKIILAFSLLILVLIVPNNAWAADGERITNFQSVASLSSQNILSVSETITVDFGPTAHHGLYRYVPIIISDGKDKFFYQFKLIGVSSSSGAPSGIAAQDTSGDNYMIKIGDANKTITGTQIYNIKYELSPIALKNGNVDRVNLNITGQDWDYPIDKASLQLTLPVAPLSTPVCYTGITGSKSSNCTVNNAGTNVNVVSNTVLNHGEGMTVDMDLPGNSLSTYLIANQKPPISQSTIIRGFLTGIACLIGIIAFFIFWWRKFSNYRLRKQQTVVAQYESPDKLTPGQVGLLVDSKTDTTELTAIVIDLAIRGYLKITRIETKSLGIFKNVDYQLDRLKAGDNLANYEKTTYDMFFSTQDTIKLSELDTINLATENREALKSIREDLGESLKQAGYYGKHANLTYSRVWIWIFIGITTSFGGFFFDSWSGFIFPYIIALGMFTYAFILIKNYPRLTQTGATEWAKVEGFKLYLNTAEKDRINFTDAPERTPELFNKLLPYAIALGVEKKWAQQFEGIDVTPSNGWYSGSDMSMISSAVFASSFASSFGSSMGSSSSFSGSSGSGSAGGGGGGGGGGGW